MPQTLGITKAVRLLASRMVELEYIDQLSHERVRQVLKKQAAPLAAKRLGDSAHSKRRVCLANGSGLGGLSDSR